MIMEELAALEARLDRQIDASSLLLNRLNLRPPPRESSGLFWYWGDLIVREGDVWPGPPGSEPSGWSR
jgi:hypothetical protein